jgi:hypothetical protein
VDSEDPGSLGEVEIQTRAGEDISCFVVRPHGGEIVLVPCV